MVFWAEVIIFSPLPPHQQCYVMVFHPLSFSFQIKVIKPSFVTRHDAVKKVIAFKQHTV
jgi:hypothetical protein